MQAQRETLQRKLTASQQLMLELETKCQALEEHAQSAQTPSGAVAAQEQAQASDSDEALAACLQLNARLQPLDEAVARWVSRWECSAQVFVLSEALGVAENERGKDKAWDAASAEALLSSVEAELEALSEAAQSGGGGGGGSALDVVSEKLALLQHVCTLRASKGEKMSEIMFAAQKRIASLQEDLAKKNREMEMHLKVNHKMYDEIKSVQNKVEELTREYQVVVSELERLRGGRKESVDSSLS